MSRLADDIQLEKPFQSIEEQLMLEIVHTGDLLWGQLTNFLKPFGLSATQYNALRILRGAGKTGLACGEISRRMVTREPDITRLLDRLERQQWIKRKRQSDDRRLVKAWLTPAGAALMAKIDQPLREFQQQQFLHLKGNVQSEIIELMEKLRIGMHAPR